MEDPGKKRGGAPSRAESRRLLVEDPGGRRPFMRGILVHSLMARGVTFEDAYATANRVHKRIRDRGTVRREELRKIVRELAPSAEPYDEPRPHVLPSPIRVEGGGVESPFSKGILSQSLLAAALEPNEAFDVARRIEEQLVRQGVDRIDRTELRRISYDALLAANDQRVAHRYLTWRHFQNGPLPVIILLGGATGSGKTALSLEVAHRLGIGRVISADAIRQVMRTMLSADLLPALHASSYDAYARLGQTAPGADPVVEGFLAQSSAVSVGVRAMMDRAIEEGESIVLDGVSIVPGQIDLHAYAAHAHVLFLVVATFGEEAYRERFARRERAGSARSSKRYLQNLSAILTIQDYILELAEQHGVPIVENVAFDSSVLSIIRYVAETLGKKESFDASGLL